MGIRSLGGQEGPDGKPASVFYDVWSQTGVEAIDNPSGGTGLTATGGIISDYAAPYGKIYRAHIFNDSGTFSVSAVGSYASVVEYLVVAGGGGGGNSGGGGGAGGCRTNVPGTPGSHTTSVTYPVGISPTGSGDYTVVGGGGGAGSAKGPTPAIVRALDGSDSSFGPPPAIITSVGGGLGGSGGPTGYPAGGTGGSGGGVGRDSGPSTGASSDAVTTPSPWPGPATQGFAGGGMPSPGGGTSGGGGGGAGAVGQEGSTFYVPAPTQPTTYAWGGDGLRSLIAGPPTGAVIGTPGPGPSTGGWVAGGGGGGVYPNEPGPIPAVYSAQGGVGGGGDGGNSDGPDNIQATSATANTGGGGGGAGGPGGNGLAGGKGGSGIVVVRYQIGSSNTSSAKGTGGAIRFYGGKTIHTFVTSDTFTNTSGAPLTLEAVVVAGGGSGGV